MYPLHLISLSVFFTAKGVGFGVVYDYVVSGPLTLENIKKLKTAIKNQFMEPGTKVVIGIVNCLVLESEPGVEVNQKFDFRVVE